MSIDVDRFTELAKQAVQEAIAGHHAAWRATCHGDGQGLYLLFPDQNTRYFPADKFPSGEPQRIPYFLKWCADGTSFARRKNAAGPRSISRRRPGRPCSELFSPAPAGSLGLVASAHFVERAPSLCGTTPLAALGG
jgi:hypothetical protein